MNREQKQAMKKNYRPASIPAGSSKLPFVGSIAFAPAWCNPGGGGGGGVVPNPNPGGGERPDGGGGCDRKGGDIMPRYCCINCCSADGDSGNGVVTGGPDGGCSGDENIPAC